MSEDTNPESEAMLNLIIQKYGDRLGDKEIEELRIDVERITENVSLLRSVPLENGDEPFSVFVPYRREG